jgi:hypothetical protein
MPAEGGTAERITCHGAVMAEESWDGKSLLYSRQEGRGPLFLLDLTGGGERQVEECVLSRALGSGPGVFYYGRARLPYCFPMISRISLSSVWSDRPCRFARALSRATTSALRSRTRTCAMGRYLAGRRSHPIGGAIA